MLVIKNWPPCPHYKGMKRLEEKQRKKRGRTKKKGKKRVRERILWLGVLATLAENQSLTPAIPIRQLTIYNPAPGDLTSSLAYVHMHIYTDTLMYTTHRKTKINLKQKKRN